MDGIGRLRLEQAVESPKVGALGDAGAVAEDAVAMRRNRATWHLKWL